MVGHVGRVRRCQRLAEEGVRPRDAAASLKMHPFVAEKAFAQAANFSAEELAHAIVRLAELDAASKGGSRLPADLELARALVDMTRRAALALPALLRLAVACEQACGLRLAAGGGVLVERAAAMRPCRASGRARDAARRPRRRRPASAASLRRRMSVFAVERQRRFSTRCRRRLADALLLLSDVRHRRRNARICGRRDGSRTEEKAVGS